MKIKGNMLALGVGAANVILCILYMSFKRAPWFTLGIVSTIAVIIAFMKTENLVTHDATEFENRFWTMAAMMLSFVLFFAVDSPLCFVSSIPSIGWILVGTATFMAHNYHRYLTRIVLSRVPNMKRVTSADFSILEHRIKAKEMLSEIRSFLHSIDRPFISSTFLNLFLLAKVLYAERRIINIFEEADPEQLNFLVLNVQLGLLLYKIKDHRYARQFHRTKLLTLLAVSRVTELSSASRAMLLDGFQRMKLSAHPQAEQWTLSIISKTKGDNLSELKSLTDCKGDFNSMHKLIYWDVRNAKVKTEILKHIEGQAKVQASHMILRTKAARMRDKFAWRKILSDVDDTLTCSGGSFPAGCDVSYPKKCIYPGVLAFYRELDLGTSGPDHWESEKRIGNLVFLSARPHLYKDLLESHSYEKFRRLQETAGMHTSPSLLPGEMVSGTEFFVSGSMEPIARKKYENFKEYLSLYPEFECVFIGDNGQGDVRASEMLVTLENGKFASNLKRTYIHEVLPVHMTFAANSSTRSRTNPGICYFTTYIEAALDAYNHGLIRLHGLRAVVNDAKSDFRQISDAAWASAEGASAVEAEIKARQLLSVIRQHNPAQSAPNNRGDSTGKDRDRSSSGADEGLSYEEVMAKLSQRKGAARDPFRGAHSPGWKRELRLRELNSAIDKVNQTLATLGRATAALSAAQPARGSRATSAISPELLTPLKPLSISCRYPVGRVVVTAYGLGIVHWFRPQDGVYEVLIHWGGNQEKPDFEVCLSRVCRLADEGRTEDLFASQSYDSHCDSPGPDEPDASARQPRALNRSQKSLTPLCLTGSIVKMLTTAACLRPAPPGAPVYMSDAPRAKTSTIWKSVTGLLRSGSKTRRHPPRSGRRRSISSRHDHKSEHRETPTPLSTTSGGVGEDTHEDSGAEEASKTASTAPSSTTAVEGSTAVVNVAEPPSGRVNGGVLSLISTMWRGRGATALGHTTDKAAANEPDYMEEYYDCLVWTPYGTGHIVYIHPADPKSGRPGEHIDAFSEDMVIVELHWGPICSIRRRSTTIIAGVVNGVHVGVGGYPVPNGYKSPNPVVQIPKRGSDSSLEEDRGSSAIASFLRYSPQSAVSRAAPNRIRAATDGNVDPGDSGSSAVKLGSHFRDDCDPSPLVVVRKRSISAQLGHEPAEEADEIPTAASLSSLGRSRANTVDSPMNISGSALPNWPPALTPAAAAAVVEERPLGYRARLLADWLFSSKSADADPDDGAQRSREDNSISEEEEEAKLQQALEDRSGLGIIANNHIESSPALLPDGDAAESDSSSDASGDRGDEDASRKPSFNEGFDPVSF